MVPPGYTVTRDGRVKGPYGTWLKPEVRGTMARVCVGADGRFRRVRLALLVCEAFHGAPPSPDAVPVHLDGNTLNNYADNLRWGTRQEAREARGTRERPDRQGEDHPLAVLTWTEVRKIREEYAAGGHSQRSLAAQYGVTSPTIHNVVNNITWKDPDYTPPPPRR